MGITSDLREMSEILGKIILLLAGTRRKSTGMLQNTLIWRVLNFALCQHRKLTAFKFSVFMFLPM